MIRFPKSVPWVFHHVPWPHYFTIWFENTTILEFQERSCTRDTWKREQTLGDKWLPCLVSSSEKQIYPNFHMYRIWSWVDFKSRWFFSFISNKKCCLRNVYLLATNSTNGCGEELSICGLCSFCYCLQHFLSCLRGSCFLRQGQFQIQRDVWLFLLQGWGGGSDGVLVVMVELSSRDSIVGKVCL